MNRYVLENVEENRRLDQQAELTNYSLEKELSGVLLKGNETVLDAGCGTGVLGRHLRQVYPGIKYIGVDLSEERIRDARKKNLQDFRFHTVDLHKRDDFAPFTEKVDVIFNRYVMHHLKDHLPVLSNFFHTLRPEGKLCIVDIDGVFVNVGTTKPHLINDIQKISENFGGTLHAARLMPSLMATVGFKNIRWEIQTMDFQGQDRIDEVEQFRERLEFGKETYIKILGGELAFRRFVKDYLAELASPTTAVFYNKFIIQAEK